LARAAILELRILDGGVVLRDGWKRGLEFVPFCMAESSAFVTFSRNAAPTAPERSNSPKAPSASTRPISGTSRNVLSSSTAGVSFTSMVPLPPTSLLGLSLPYTLTHVQRSKCSLANTWLAGGSGVSVAL
jgi:hypothetical protein